MKFTVITDANAKFFGSAIGELYSENKRNRMFFGVLDDEDAAVGAVAWEQEGEALHLFYIGVADEKRREGYGSFLIGQSRLFSEKQDLGPLVFTFYEKSEELEKNEMVSFLIKNGFSVYEAPVERQVYLLSDIFEKEDALLKGEDNTDYKFIPGPDFDPGMRNALTEAAMDPQKGFSYFDPELFFSEENRYGGAICKGKEIVSAATILPFSDGIRFDQLHGSLQDISVTRDLLRQCMKRVKKEEGLKHFYLDIGGKKLIRSQHMIFEKTGISCEYKLQGYVGRG